MAAPVFTKVGQSEDESSKCLPNQTDDYPVCVNQSLQDFTASQGQLVVLECRVKGAPSPQVDWFREGKLLEDSPDYRILQKSEIWNSSQFIKISS